MTLLAKIKFPVSQQGSVLVFSLIVLSFLLIAALSLAGISLIDQKAASSTDRSTVAFQAADSAAEIFLQKVYKGNPPTGYTTLTDLCNSISGCTCNDAVLTGSLSGFKNMSSTYRLTFYDNDQILFTDDNCNDPAWRTDIVYIKSEGIYGSTVRAIQLVLAAPTTP